MRGWQMTRPFLLPSPVADPPLAHFSEKTHGCHGQAMAWRFCRKSPRDDRRQWSWGIAWS